jgi:hypothetical protein
VSILYVARSNICFALDRLLSHRGGAWLTNEPQAIVLAHADRLLAEAREP